jgi:tetratricopeptide (TPR) repeat protein
MAAGRRTLLGTAACLASFVVMDALAPPALGAGQGLSDRVAHCERTQDTESRVLALASQVNRSMSPEEGFNHHVTLGRTRIGNCDFVGALADFDRALRAKPPSVALNAQFHIGRADAHLRLEQRDLALSEYEAALAQKPSMEEEAHIYQMRGFIHTDKGDERQAIADFTRLIMLKPDFADAYWFRAVSYENLNDYASALADYDRLAQLRPDDWTGWSQVCWGHGYLNSGLLEGLRACDIALQLNPGDANTLDGRGFVNFRLGRFAVAVEDYNAALRQNPPIPSSLYLRGLAKLRLDDEEGKKDIEAAEAVEPGIGRRFAGYGIAP